MNRSGEKWTALEVCYLYYLVLSRKYSPSDIADMLGRSVKALQFKVQNGSLFDEGLLLIEPTISYFTFYKNLKSKYQVMPPKTPGLLKKGGVNKLFRKYARDITRLGKVSRHKEYLIPLMNKWDAKKKHKDKDPWWRFAHNAQANPFLCGAFFIIEKIRNVSYAINHFLKPIIKLIIAIMTMFVHIKVRRLTFNMYLELKRYQIVRRVLNRMKVVL